MSNILRKMPLTNPADENERHSTVRMLRTLVIILLATGVITLILTLFGNYGIVLTVSIVALLIFSLVSLILLGRGHLLPAQILLPTALYVVVTSVVATGYGVHDVDAIAFAGVIAVAGLTLGQDATLIFGVLIAFSSFAIGIAETQGWLVSPTSSLTNTVTAINFSVVVMAIAFVQRVLIGRLNENIRRAHENEQKQIQANLALEEERLNLETRVVERTQALERRTIQLRTAVEVGNAAASFRNLDGLLNQAVRLIGNRFGFYHAGIFFLDEPSEFAVLRAANSEGGQRMLQRGHKLEVGRVGIVGYAAKMSQARIALDVGKDAVFFNNPDLPETRSEMALPLNVGGRVLGVLDIQSTEPQAFTEEDVEVLQVVADQLAVAIENSRLLAESQSATEAARRAYGEIAIEAWKQLLEREQTLGFVSDGRETRPLILAKEDASPESFEAFSKNIPVTSADQVKLFTPIAIRGQSIGVLRLVKPHQERWMENEIQIVQSLADQLSGALESARLYDEAQRLAAKEQTIANITSKISTSINMRNVLQIAAEELGHAIPGSEVVIQFQDNREIEQSEK